MGVVLSMIVSFLSIEVTKNTENEVAKRRTHFRCGFNRGW